jgi:outer membrane lipoprotein LolB
MRWSGRLSLVVSSSPAQSLSAGFELAGGPVSGTLVLSGPLGSRVATLRWGPEAAFLTSQGETRRFKTLAELTGAALPINAVFEWLQGRAVPADHWEVDLSRLNDGRLTARRLQIEPKAELRLILEP